MSKSSNWRLPVRILRSGYLTLAWAFALLVLGLPASSSQSANAAQAKNLPPGQNILWQDPGAVETLDLVYGPGGEAKHPRPPFQFTQEELSGTTPKVRVKDASGVTWIVKWGEEAKPSTFATRLVWACGYTAEIEYLIARGQIEGVHGLKRAAPFVHKDGSFIDGRFQLRSDSPRFLSDHNWAWTSNPFLGSQELNGLKILMMLLSNWDVKDARDSDSAAHSGTADSNLAIFGENTETGPRYLYFVSDWGASLGRWGSGMGLRSKWDCKNYAAQSADFVQGSNNGTVRWGYGGKHNDDMVKGIRVADVQWLLKYLGRITDEQLRRGLAASGANPDQMDCYLRSIRQRINALQAVKE